MRFRHFNVETNVRWNVTSFETSNMISSPWFSENHRTLAIRKMAKEVCISSGYYNHMFGNE
jgi:hypothetical protein